MFMGHYGPAVWDTQRGKGDVLIPLWVGFLAVQFIDVIWAILIILGLEGGIRMVESEPHSNIPYSHSLISALVLSVLAGLMYKLFQPKVGVRGFWVICALVFSHWIFDLIVHRPDLPLWPGSGVELGFGVWNWPILAFLLEIGLLLTAFLYWLRVTTGPRSSLIALSVLFVFMVIIQFMFITVPGMQVQHGEFDPNAGLQGAALGVSALFIYGILTGSIAWIEKRRTPIT